jgi:mRNA interferase HigB
MHVITQKRIWEAKEKFPDAAGALQGWYKIVSKNRFNNYSELKRIFNTIDKVKDYYVFDIGGNKVRLIANIHFNRQKIYIRHVLSHKEYDKNNWK